MNPSSRLTADRAYLTGAVRALLRARFIEFEDDILFLVSVTGGADDDCLLVFGAKRCRIWGGLVETEIDHGIATGNGPGKIIANINCVDYLNAIGAFGTGNERLTHAAFGSMNDDIGHVT